LFDVILRFILLLQLAVDKLFRVECAVAAAAAVAVAVVAVVKFAVDGIVAAAVVVVALFFNDKDID